jgi:hypothetical protein
MAIKQMRVDEIEVVCLDCGALTVVPLSRLVAREDCVALPWCAACARSCSTLNVIPGPITKRGEGVVRQAATKALHAELIRRGQWAPGVMADAVASGAHEGALAWPTTDVCEVPLSGPVQRAYTAWQAAQGR